MNLTFTTLTESNLRDVLIVLNDAFQMMGNEEVIDKRFTKSIEKLRKIGESKFKEYNIPVVAILGDEVIGYAQIGIHECIFDEKHATLWWGAIKKEYQGKGYGKQMQKHCLDLCEEQGVAEVRLTTGIENYASQKTAISNGFVDGLAFKYKFKKDNTNEKKDF